MSSNLPVLRFKDLTPETAITIPTSEQDIQMCVQDVIRWVAPDAPPTEALKFLLTCRSAQLNPFLGEAYLVPMGGKWSTVIAKSGYLKRAQRYPEYDGHESGIIVRQYDARSKQFGAEIRDIPGTVLPSGWVVIGGWAKVYRKGVGRPIHVRLSMDEFNKGTATWKTLPCTMIRKTALVNAIREAFAIGDSYDDAEIEPVRFREARYTEQESTAAATTTEVQSLPAPVAEAARQEPSAPAASFPPPTDSSGSEAKPDVLTRIYTAMAKLGMTDTQLTNALSRRGVLRLSDLAPNQAEEFAAKLEDRLDQEGFLDRVLQPTGAGSSETAVPAETSVGGTIETGQTGDDPSPPFEVADQPRRETRDKNENGPVLMPEVVAG